MFICKRINVIIGFINGLPQLILGHCLRQDADKQANNLFCKYISLEIETANFN